MGSKPITTFIQLGLVDEFRLSVHPVILGEGKPLFMDIKQRLNLKMVNTKHSPPGSRSFIIWIGMQLTMLTSRRRLS